MSAAGGFLVSGPGYALRMRAGETLLDALLRAGVPARFSCRSGSCHACLQRCVAGVPPARSQQGLQPALAAQGWFLPCVCVPETDMELAPAAAPCAGAPAPASAPRAAPGPDPQLWAELEDGRLVRRVLDDFYARVFADPLLAPYFSRVTPAHAAGKQYAFLCQQITGQPVYFGESMRNAHHWMVISDALLAHRQALMRAAQRAHGLTEDQIRRWEAHELHHRDAIVKDAPVPKVLAGHALPLEGYGTETLQEGSLCDGCGAELPAGTVVRYHLRLGHVSCAACSALAVDPA